MTTLLTEMELHMRATKVPQTRLGLLAVGDKRLIMDLQCGRAPGPVLAARVRAYMAANPQSYRHRGPAWWTAERDRELQQMLADGATRGEAAARLGKSLAAVNCRCTTLARAGWNMRRPAPSQPVRRWPNGRDLPPSVWTDTRYAEIDRLCAAGASRRQIAVRLGTSLSALEQGLARKRKRSA